MTAQTMMKNYGSYSNAQAHRRFGEKPLTLDEIRAAAPSVFAAEKHESRSERYTFLPTIAAVEALQNEGFQPYTVKQGKSRVEGKADYTKHLIRFRHESLLDVKSGDTVLEVALRNSHDGTSAWEIMGGLWRVTCLNALVSGGQLLVHHQVPHKGNQLDNVVEGTFKVLHESRRLIEAPEEWSAVQLNRGEAQAFANAARVLRFDDGMGEDGERQLSATGKAIEPKQLLAPNRAEDVGPDLWKVFNRVQENVMKGGLEAIVTRTDDQGVEQARRVTTRAVKGIDDDVRLNRALWVLAEQMAALKA